MAKPNYQFEKRQRELAKRQKQEEKRRHKLGDKAAAGSGDSLSAHQTDDILPPVPDVAPPESDTA